VGAVRPAPESRRWTVVFGVDDEYTVPLTVALQSLHDCDEQLAQRLDLVVLHEALSAQSLALLDFHSHRLGLRLVTQAVSLPGLTYNLAFGGTRANYLRLAIPEVLSGEDRVLYLDADVVVCAGLAPLLHTDLHGLPLGAVRDPVNPTYERGRALPSWRELGIPGDREYFNSGVLLVDLVAARRDRLFERAFDVVANHADRLRLWDQDALNVAAADRWHRLDRRWNTAPFSALLRTPWIRYAAEDLVPVTELVGGEADAAVMHYVSPAKPWKGLLPDGPANVLYQRHLAAVRAAERREPAYPSGKEAP
jgi:lipopolysaccharide biosynthesis glycosyltransferase